MVAAAPVEPATKASTGVMQQSEAPMAAKIPVVTIPFDFFELSKFSMTSFYFFMTETVLSV